MSSWELVKSTTHFNLWERVKGDGCAVDMCINHREPGKHYYPVWRRRFPIEDGLYSNNGIDQAIATLKKFEAFWPCTFLAKEYIKGGLK